MHRSRILPRCHLKGPHLVTAGSTPLMAKTQLCKHMPLPQLCRNPSYDPNLHPISQYLILQDITFISLCFLPQSSSPHFLNVRHITARISLTLAQNGTPPPHAPRRIRSLDTKARAKRNMGRPHNPHPLLRFQHSSSRWWRSSNRSVYLYPLSTRSAPFPLPFPLVGPSKSSGAQVLT